MKDSNHDRIRNRLTARHRGRSVDRRRHPEIAVSERKSIADLNDILRRVQQPLMDLIAAEAARGSNPLLVWAVIGSITFTNAMENTDDDAFAAWISILDDLVLRSNVSRRERIDQTGAVPERKAD